LVFRFLGLEFGVVDTPVRCGSDGSCVGDRSYASFGTLYIVYYLLSIIYRIWNMVMVFVSKEEQQTYLN